MRNRLAIAVSLEAVPARRQPPAQLAIIVDFPVENQRDRTIFVIERLIAASDVDDLEPPHRHAEIAVDEIAIAIRSAMP